MICVVEPVGDEIAERFIPGGTMERLEQKMTEYPRGTLFEIDARPKEYFAVHRFFDESRPWTLKPAALQRTTSSGYYEARSPLCVTAIL
jgi:hypothetical protein